MTSKLRFGFASFLMIASMFVLVSCGGDAPADTKTEEVKTETPAKADDHAGHDHDDHAGHDHGTDEAKQGKEYTSAYICPMHCEGSGAEEMGKCPACGMDYVANEKTQGHDGHDHDGHDHGHDHGSHEGHAH